MEPRSKSPRPPSHLSKASAAWWSRIAEAYELSDHHVRLLTAAAESWDRAQEARRTLAREGITYTDRWGAPRRHPATSIENESMLRFARLVRELDLSDEPAPDARPPRLRGRPR